MTGKQVWKVLFALVIVTGLVLGGVAIYRAGFTHGAMTSFTQPESSGDQVAPFRPLPYRYGFGPRVGLLGLFPLLCFGGFFFLLLFFGFGFCARRRAWMHYRPGAHHHWTHHGPPPGDQPQSESNTASAETEKPET